jgi:DNA uptake protein ComE-like DNA-binding protein
MLSQLKNYFTFSRSERRGSIVFSVIILILIIILYSLEYIFSPGQTDFSAFEAQIDSFYAARTLAHEQLRDTLQEAYKNKYKKNKSSYNTNYKAGNLYNKTENSTQGSNSPSLRKEPVPNLIREVGGLAGIELNSADSLALIKLKGIGKVLASRILKYRSMLGGFAFKEQLKEVYGIDSVLYQSIQTYISVNPEAIQKININFADAQSLGKHPYVKYDKAKAIIYYRKQAGEFESLEDIKNAVFLSEEEFQKLEPYLEL